MADKRGKSPCKHDWQPAKDLYKGRYRCAKCLVVGYKKDKTGEIVQYVEVPTWVTEESPFWEFRSFYPVSEGGRCPSMDSQERLMLSEDPELDEDDFEF